MGTVQFMSARNGRDRSNPKVDQFIIQMSAAEDRGPQEEAAAAEGFIPLVVFANGPENAFLVRATSDVLDAALNAANLRLGEGAGARLTFRSSVFSAMRTAIEQDFSSQEAMDQFTDLTLHLFAEALAEHGVQRASTIPACAVGFTADSLAQPDFETADDGAID